MTAAIPMAVRRSAPIGCNGLATLVPLLLPTETTTDAGRIPVAARVCHAPPSFMPAANRLLAGLPRETYERLLSLVVRVPLPRGHVLYARGDPMRFAYFPLSGLVSLLATTAQGQTVEVAMTGNDGLVGLPIILHVDIASHQTVVQIAGEAFRVPADILRAECTRNASLQVALLRSTHALLDQLSQSAVCHRFHAVLPRLSRCLLVAQDRGESETLFLTHETIAHRLGIPRNRVTAAAVALQDAGVIQYRHGKISIVNRRRLEAEACECYRSGRGDGR